MADPVVAFVLLNWNQTDLTLACLRSLACLDYPEKRVVLVDNGSMPVSLEAIESEFPDLVLLRNKRNLGFTGGNNVGIQRALADGANYVMLLNNDTEVAPDMLRLLLDFAEADEGIGVVGPLIYYFQDPNRIWSAGGLVDPRTGSALSPGEGQVDDGQRVPVQVDYVSGCALLIKARVIEDVGLLDDRMFIYYEEADWCARAREAGYQIWLVPEANVWHKISMEARALSRRYVYLMTRNRLLYLRNRGASWQRLLRVIVGLDLRAAIAWSLRPKHRERRAMRTCRLRGAIDFLMGRFGEPPFPV